MLIKVIKNKTFKAGDYMLGFKIDRCSCCKKIKWIYKNKYDVSYNQKLFWKCYCGSIERVKENHARQRELNKSKKRKE